MSESDKPNQTDQRVTNNSARHDAPQSSRRRLLKKSVAIPVIMTLHSGAAMARSSNLAGAEISVHEGVAGNDDDVYCALPEGQIDEGAYDMGDYPKFTHIPRQKEGGVSKTDEEIIEECRLQGIEGEGGILISSTAFNSILGRAGWKEI